MAKSLRSKTKRAYRATKREKGVYAVADAARLHRLNAKLQQIVSRDRDGDMPIEEEDMTEDNMPTDDTPNPTQPEDDISMQTDVDGTAKKVSTHGPRNSRRDEWRRSKGLAARPKRTGMNRKGELAARYKSGRSKRRR